MTLDFFSSPKNEARKLAQIADQSEDDAKSPFGGVNLWFVLFLFLYFPLKCLELTEPFLSDRVSDNRTLAVDLLSSSSTSGSSRNHSRSTSPNLPSESSTDRTKISSLRKEEEPRERKTSSLRLPAFLRRKSASDEKEKEVEKAASVNKIDGLPPSSQAESATKQSAVVEGGTGEALGAPAPLAKPVLS